MSVSSATRALSERFGPRPLIRLVQGLRPRVSGLLENGVNPVPSHVEIGPWTAAGLAPLPSPSNVELSDYALFETKESNAPEQDIVKLERHEIRCTVRREVDGSLMHPAQDVQRYRQPEYDQQEEIEPDQPSRPSRRGRRVDGPDLEFLELPGMGQEKRRHYRERVSFRFPDRVRGRRILGHAALASLPLGYVHGFGGVLADIQRVRVEIAGIVIELDPSHNDDRHGASTCSPFPDIPSWWIEQFRYRYSEILFFGLIYINGSIMAGQMFR